MSYDLRLGRWQDVLADVECDALICDPPYSARTQSGYRTATDFTEAAERERKARAVKDARTASLPGGFRGNMPRGRFELPYPPITRDDAFEFIGSWTKRARNWIVVFGDHISHGWFCEAMDAAGWITFAPIPWLRRDAPPRFAGDGPANMCEWIAVGRPRKRVRVGSLPGFYDFGLKCEKVVTGGKPPDLMRAIVRDYSDPGDTIVDPCAGGGTTLLAALCEKRRAIGAELDPITHAKADARLRAWCEMPLFDTQPEQQELLR